jgi:hypothetical protein
MGAKQPDETNGQSEVVARLVAFLASEDAA